MELTLDEKILLSFNFSTVVYFFGSFGCGIFRSHSLVIINYLLNSPKRFLKVIFLHPHFVVLVQVRSAVELLQSLYGEVAENREDLWTIRQKGGGLEFGDRGGGVGRRCAPNGHATGREKGRGNNNIDYTRIWLDDKNAHHIKSNDF